ncbi:HD domain-containing phosphohydrolase [Opitutus terrae]|uniref:Response regulator receiver protein n=1 Tax=Opitutus terrae (strain DSM 11246 / JCM 15787 / PB90-1) TaxID=452637 RepID=B1ZR53_OPITP|nr:HD domain-containing phosphohydrolase [Opitutus terrae]ACB73720.1 response regulator receiver protein [Opitutus terrae PB90-1]
MTAAKPDSSPTILIVDDEPVVLAALQQTLERERFHVVACTSPTKALAMVAERDFAVIISDQRMPEMLGLDFLIESRRIRPLASRILITAVLSLPTIVDAINKGEIFRFVAKPWLREELIATVRNAVHRHELITQNQLLQAETQRLNEELTQANASLAARVKDLEQQRQHLDAANRELAASYEHSLELCRRILTTYDPILGGQAKALVEYAQHMTQSDLLDGAQKHALRAAAWLCDLGLIGVPREMLRAFRSKIDELTDRERAMLHNHPVYSQTLAALVDDAPGVGETIRAHHERYDGSGYPDGLAGDAIPWPARCLAVAVGYVESGLPKAAGIDLVLSQSGTAYDPEAVRLFLKVTNLAQLPRQVREITLHELEPGMVLANGIYSPHGLLLIGEGQELSPNMIAKIRIHNQATPINQRLLVRI